MTMRILWFSLSLLVLGGCDPRSLWGNAFLEAEEDRRCIDDPMACAPCDGPGCEMKPPGVRCTRGADCPQSGVCRVDASYPGDVAPGACVPADKVCVVDAAACPQSNRDGSAARPFCEPAEAVGRCAIARLQPRRDGMRYGALHLTGGSLALFGAGRGKAETTLNGASVNGMGTGLTLIELTVERGAGKDGVTCENGAQMHLKQVAVQGNEVGLITSDCGQITVESTLVSGNRNDGVHIGRGTREYRIVNSLIVANGLDPAANAIGVYLDTGGKGRFAFNTVIGNGRRETDAGGVFCSLTAGIVDSIIVDNGSGARMTQLGGTCRLERVVVGTTDSTLLLGAIKVAPMLEPQTYRLTAESACCIDKAAADQAVLWDYEGTARPQRQGYDIGSHELR
jgi:hypothetical protein